MIWLMRHAKAAGGLPDEARPLTGRGLRDAAAAGRALQALGVHLDACLASPKRRTVQTAELVCAPLGLEVTAEPALAGGDFDAQRLVAGLGDTLLVGHNPAISVAVNALSGARVSLRPGGLAAVARSELVLALTPEVLLAIAAQAQNGA
ncbi:MAG: SixA phosphatase family protein [Solirubrobacteraceae bacterium]